MGKIIVTAIAGSNGPELEIKIDNCPPAKSGTYRGNATFELTMRGIGNLSPLTETIRKTPVAKSAEAVPAG